MPESSNRLRHRFGRAEIRVRFPVEAVYKVTTCSLTEERSADYRDVEVRFLSGGRYRVEAKAFPSKKAHERGLVMEFSGKA